MASLIRADLNEYPQKYYPFASIVEHMIDCFHHIVSDESNPYHPPLSWLTRRQPKPPDDELFTNLMDECSMKLQRSAKKSGHIANGNNNHRTSANLTNATTPVTRLSSQLTNDKSDNHSIRLSSSVRTRLERLSQEARQEIVCRTRDGCSPLFAACQNGLNTVVRYLIDVCGADLEQKGRYETIEDQRIHVVTPIWVASISGHYEVVKLLIESGANVNSLSDTGSTPLRSVCFVTNYDDGDDTRDRKSERRSRRNNEPVSPTPGALSWVLSANIQNYNNIEEHNDNDYEENDCPFMRIVKILVENGAEVRLANYSGGTCLMNSLHNYELCEYILSHGAEVNAVDNNRKTALHYAIQTNRLNVTKLLLTHGADPFLKTDSGDDALRLSCIGGYESIFKHLISNYTYSLLRLVDAYKLLGSSILELRHDMARVRAIWIESCKLQATFSNQTESDCSVFEESQPGKITCTDENTQRRRSLAYGGHVKEFATEQELEDLDGDALRIQSLLITERILGQMHQETIQRLLHRGTYYMSSLQRTRCLELWVYAFRLHLDRNSIFDFETFLAARAIKRLILEMMEKQPSSVRFDDVYDVLEALVFGNSNNKHHSCPRLEESVRLLDIRPRSYLHQDLFDLLLWIVANLLLMARCCGRNTRDNSKLDKIISEIGRINPKASDGSPLHHIFITTNLVEDDVYGTVKQLLAARNQQHGPADAEQQPRLLILELLAQLLDAGLKIDEGNNGNLSALQVICLAKSRIRFEDKRDVIRFLVERGAHVDRRAMRAEDEDQIRVALQEAGVDLFSCTRLSCLAARQVSAISKINPAIELNFGDLPSNIRHLVRMH